MPLDLNNLDDAEAFQRHFVNPVVEQMGTKIEAMLKPVLDGSSAANALVQKHEDRIAKLESSQRKALLGYSWVVALVTAGAMYAKDWAAKKFFNKQ